MRNHDGPYLNAARASEPGYRKLGTVPMARRIEVRHIIREVTSLSQDTERAMLIDSLNADGCISDIHRMIDNLQAIVRLLR